MTESKIEVIKLKASDGYVLTNNEIYGKEIYLGCGDNKNNYYEITQENYDQLLNSTENDNNEDE